MFRRIVYSAFGAGLAVAFVVSALQFFTTVPLILHAEVFEQAGEAPSASPAAAAGSQHESIAATEEGEWAPSDGVERAVFTSLANLVAGVAISLILLGLMGFSGEAIDAKRGLLWGLGGFFAASLLPALGLPPELPATPSAELFSRQVWWIGAALASAVGLGLLVLVRHWAAGVVGVLLLAAPHVIGAPRPPTLEAGYPAGLGVEFAVASLVVGAALWVLSGFASGWVYQRLSRPA